MTEKADLGLCWSIVNSLRETALASDMATYESNISDVNV